MEGDDSSCMLLLGTFIRLLQMRLTQVLDLEKVGNQLPVRVQLEADKPCGAHAARLLLAFRAFWPLGQDRRFAWLSQKSSDVGSYCRVELDYIATPPRHD